jgi:endo-1,4-beta-D-glucanase Y
MIDLFRGSWLQYFTLLIITVILPVFYPAEGMDGGLSNAVKPKSTPASRWDLPQLLQESWQFYKGRFLVDGSHVVSNAYGGTISEGQSYALLKALWMNEPDTFNQVWQWTKLNLKRPNDSLLGWRWGNGAFGTQPGLMEVDNAPDADQDIAYALLLAGKQWHRPDYTQDGLNIVKDLWRLNVQYLDGRYYLISGTWQGFKQDYLTLNPSYFAPYVYREFARADLAHASGWNQLANDSYDTLEACTNLTRPKLPPNWCAVKWQDDHQGSRIIFSDRQGEGSRDFSYDAFRVYWRMAMDAKLSPAPGRDRARAYLKSHPFLLDYWRQHLTMPEGFTAEGQPRTEETSGFGMGPLLVLNQFQRPDDPEGALYQQSLAPHFHSEGYWFNDYNDFLHSVIWLHLYALNLKSM